MEPSATMLMSGLRTITVLLMAAAGACALVHKTIESDDGDVIDCVDMYHQPALKHAGSRVIQARPETSMKEMAAAASASEAQERHQTWRKRGSCPAGTVPIRRPSSRADPEAADLLRRFSPFGRPGGGGGNSDGDRSAEGSSYYNNLSDIAVSSPGSKVEVAAAYATNGPYLGARADVPYWRVDVHTPDEFSMNYILIGRTLDRSFKPSRTAKRPHLTNLIVVGLVAWPSFYGDSLSRLFVYYTNDSGVANNCFNLDCGGFHLIENSPYALGASWDNSDSQVGGDRYGVTFGIHRDPAGANWWVSVLDQDIGYYPESIFDTTFIDGSYVEMGGRVLDTRPGGAHTITPMGNGMPACAGWLFAATVVGYRGVSYNGVLFNDVADRTITSTPGCYGAQPIGIDKLRGGFSVVYGGPGGIYCDRN